MTTRELIDKLPTNVRAKIEELKKTFKLFPVTDWHKHNEVRATINGYTRGLCDAGLITERERQILYVYTTL